MARAINCLPTPDSPSSKTGMVDFAARSPSRATRSMSGLLLARSVNDKVPETCRFSRRTSSSSAATRSAFLIETCSRSAPTGFTTKSIAPARIAEMTASIEPLAVCTMAGIRRPCSRIRPSTAMPSRSGMTRSRIRRSISASPAPASQPAYAPARLLRLRPSRPHNQSGEPRLRAARAAPGRRQRSEFWGTCGLAGGSIGPVFGPCWPITVNAPLMNGKRAAASELAPKAALRAKVDLGASPPI